MVSTNNREKEIIPILYRKNRRKKGSLQYIIVSTGTINKMYRTNCNKLDFSINLHTC